MTVEQQVKILCVKANISMAEMARRLNKSPQAFCQKVKRGSFTVNELEDIALIAGCELKCEFVYMNGERISVK